MSYHDFKSEWDHKPDLLKELPLYALRAWRNVLRDPVWFAVSWQTDREDFDRVMDLCDAGRTPREFAKWWDTCTRDVADGHVGEVHVDRVRVLQRYRNVIRAIEHVEAREIAELIAGRAA